MYVHHFWMSMSCEWCRYMTCIMHNFVKSSSLATTLDHINKTYPQTSDPFSTWKSDLTETFVHTSNNLYSQQLLYNCIFMHILYCIIFFCIQRQHLSSFMQYNQLHLSNSYRFVFLQQFKTLIPLNKTLLHQMCPHPKNHHAMKWCLASWQICLTSHKSS
jgi:hypothetical protein